MWNNFNGLTATIVILKELLIKIKHRVKLLQEFIQLGK